MPADPRQTVEDLFARALELGPDARARFLDEACAGDGALRAEVESLLRADSNRGGFLAGPANAGLEIAERPDPFVGRSIGPWRILERIGRGGMGSVYLAERADASYEGRAAIKVARRGMETPELLRRFHHERRLLARLQHPHIARLLDGGALEDGLPYFVMEHVAGMPIDRYCEERDLALEARLDVFLAVCDAVQYAHQQLIVHRDLKPSNILVTGDGTPRLLDFGIAKALGADSDDSGAMTREGERPRTPTSTRSVCCSTSCWRARRHSRLRALRPRRSSASCSRGTRRLRASPRPNGTRRSRAARAGRGGSRASSRAISTPSCSPRSARSPSGAIARCPTSRKTFGAIAAACR